MLNSRNPVRGAEAGWSDGPPDGEGRDASHAGGSLRTLPRDSSGTPPARNAASAYWGKIIPRVEGEALPNRGQVAQVRRPGVAERSLKIGFGTPTGAHVISFIMKACRGVAQPGSAPALGAGGPRFKSARPDHFYPPAPAAITAMSYSEQWLRSPASLRLAGRANVAVPTRALSTRE